MPAFRFHRPLSMLLAFLAAAAAPAAAELLVADVRTNYLPGFDFTVARAEVSQGGVVLARGETPAFIGDGDTLRIADFELPRNRDYVLEVELVHRTGRPLARRQVLVDLRENLVTTVLVVKPTGTAEKTAALIADNDGDGAVSAGDMLRYTVVADGDIARFSDDPGPGLRLAIGSVTTSFGTVTRGNEGVDFLVAVDGLQGAPGPVTITFDCEVMPVMENQGELELADPSEDSPRFARISIPTDDPATEPLGDATRTLVTCTGGPRCVEDLEQCERSLGTCRAERQELKDQLTALLSDPDRDGVAAVLDLCAKTGSSDPVDDRGCSQAQFCRRIDLAQKQGEAICRRGDWRADEPLGAPRDCQPVKGTCVPE